MNLLDNEVPLTSSIKPRNFKRPSNWIPKLHVHTLKLSTASHDNVAAQKRFYYTKSEESSCREDGKEIKPMVQLTFSRKRSFSFTRDP